MVKQDAISKIKDFHTIRVFKDIVGSENPILTGGAIVDILDGRTPKDYDFVGVNVNHIEKFTDAGYKFISETKTALTYMNNEIVVQFLKTQVSEFDFTISQGRYSIKNSSLNYFDFDSYNSRFLRCTSYDKDLIMYSALLRLPHWYGKKFKIAPSSYGSLLRGIKRTNIQSNS